MHRLLLFSRSFAVACAIYAQNLLSVCHKSSDIVTFQSSSQPCGYASIPIINHKSLLELENEYLLTCPAAPSHWPLQVLRQVNVRIGHGQVYVVSVEVRSGASTKLNITLSNSSITIVFRSLRFNELSSL